MRGLMLVLMMLTHLPTRLTTPAGQPFGFVSAAEGFVLLSACMAGMVYSRIGRRDGASAMRKALWRRSLKIYLCQAWTLLFLFTVIAAVGIQLEKGAVRNLMSFYFHEPYSALIGSLALIYQPPLLDILPLYVLFMLVSPWLLAHAMRAGWAGIMSVSLSLWALAQFGLGEWIHGLAVQWFGLSVPVNETGAFSTFAWQFLWVFGLWLGAAKPRDSTLAAWRMHLPRWVVLTAIVVGAVGFVWRHLVGQAPFGANVGLNLLFDKWQLAPLRLLNLFALLVLALHFRPWLAKRLPRMQWLEIMGSAALPVFCTHLVLVLLTLAIWGERFTARPWWGDVLLLASSLGAMYAVALATQWVDRAPQKSRIAKARQRAQLRAAGLDPLSESQPSGELPAPSSAPFGPTSIPQPEPYGPSPAAVPGLLVPAAAVARQ